MKNRTEKKSQMNQVFVYVLSFIIIIFCAFIATKFIYSFSQTTEDSVNNKFYSGFAQDYNEVHRTYGLEKDPTYRVSDNIKLVCFIQNKNCINTLTPNDVKGTQLDLTFIQTQLHSIVDSGEDNIIMFDNSDILNSKKMPEFNACFCVKPKGVSVSLYIQNIKNKVNLIKADS